MKQTVKRRKEEGGQKRNGIEREARGREKKKQAFAPCCFLFFLFSFPPFYYGFK